MTTREHADVDAEGRQPFASRDDLSGLKGVLFTARDMEGDCIPELANDRREIPAGGVAASA